MRKIMILLGRSGCGKSTIAELLKANYGYKTTRSATTRDRRDGEAEDAYYFMSKDEFIDCMLDDEFVEWAVYNEQYYGTLKKELQTEEKLVIIMTPEGAEAIKKEFPETFVVYVETDLKTAVMRAIEREDIMDIGKLDTICTRACTDDYIFRKPVCDFTLSNPVGAALKDVVDVLVKAHKNWNDDLELLEML